MEFSSGHVVFNERPSFEPTVNDRPAFVCTFNLSTSPACLLVEGKPGGLVRRAGWGWKCRRDAEKGNTQIGFDAAILRPASSPPAKLNAVLGGATH